jgi:hypothetical protein
LALSHAATQQAVLRKQFSPDLDTGVPIGYFSCTLWRIANGGGPVVVQHSQVLLNALFSLAALAVLVAAGLVLLQDAQALTALLPPQ